MIMTIDKKTLDRTDIKILDILQRNGKISNVDLAAQVHLSPSPCLERVRSLEKYGYIKEYVAHLNPELLDAELVAYIEVSLKRTATKNCSRQADPGTGTGRDQPPQPERLCAGSN